MSTRHISLFSIALAGIGGLSFGVWLLRFLWRELSAYMRNQRFGE